MEDRLSEHKRAVKNSDMTNAIAKHKCRENHEIDFNNTKVLFNEKNEKLRILLEGYSIAANVTRKMNLSPANTAIMGWIELFRNAWPDLVY